MVGAPLALHAMQRVACERLEYSDDVEEIVLRVGNRSVAVFSEGQRRGRRRLWHGRRIRWQIARRIAETNAFYGGSRPDLPPHNATRILYANGDGDVSRGREGFFSSLDVAPLRVRRRGPVARPFHPRAPLAGAARAARLGRFPPRLDAPVAAHRPALGDPSAQAHRLGIATAAARVQAS